MQLRSAPASPFARKIRMMVKHLCLEDRIAIVPTNTAQPDPAFLAQNPLGKIPTHVLDDGQTLFGSAVIAAYLDDLVGGGRLIPLGAGRFPALRFEALADGVMEAIVLIVYERRWHSEDRRAPSWIAHQQGKIDRGLAELDRDAMALEGGEPHVGHFALAAALGYLDLRFEGAWRVNHPGLVPWLELFASR